eukprot:CAMPEP_0197684734 /NCGR_PEP_ID=MMETSP1338-20131121/99889_1 /TAXON_ID=43686 ORGANISM="Pelagodinium beii, Strain RCC1491" /NCGR_SAMPLE_ID=MMETSP1338 /ASSEMBLY_ACC=CAM_ASM_000754 /LENGTH=42 /DNA_ID= /DNA_START= /DNA_END= /DNA_ORIENTATION=
MNAKETSDQESNDQESGGGYQGAIQDFHKGPSKWLPAEQHKI